jgi:hypothetical protein
MYSVLFVFHVLIATEGIMNTMLNPQARRRLFFPWIALIALMSSEISFAQIPVPATGCYHAAYTPYTQDSFENLAGKSIAIELIYRSWKGSANFDQYSCDRIISSGAYPYLAWEPWDGNINSTTYSLQSIINGTHDALIQRWATGIKQWNKPLLLRWAHEMNGSWYPWDGFHNGGDTLTGYGSPTKPDGPERYIDAYRHIHHIFDSIGVPKVSWVWCPNTMWDTTKVLNKISSYFPGADVVDWIGMNCYNWGSSAAGMSWKSAEQMFRLTYTGAVALADKPILVGESASTEVGGDKAAWISATFGTIRTAFPKIKLFTWFNENKETDWRINSSPAALAAYRAAIADPYFIGSVLITRTHVPGPDAIDHAPARRGSRITIELPDPRSTTVTLFTLQGRSIAVFQATEFFDLTGYTAGTYLMRVTDKSGARCQRIILTQ